MRQRLLRDLKRQFCWQLMKNDKVWLDRKTIDPRAIKATINRLRAENPEGEVVVQADVESTAETVIKVVDALKDAGIPIPAVATSTE